MKMPKLWTAACPLPAGTGRSTRFAHLHRRSWLPVAAASVAICAFVVRGRCQEPE